MRKPSVVWLRIASVDFEDAKDHWAHRCISFAVYGADMAVREDHSRDIMTVKQWFALRECGYTPAEIVRAGVFPFTDLIAKPSFTAEDGSCKK